VVIFMAASDANTFAIDASLVFRRPSSNNRAAR